MTDDSSRGCVTWVLEKTLMSRSPVFRFPLGSSRFELRTALTTSKMPSDRARSASRSTSTSTSRCFPHREWQRRRRAAALSAAQSRCRSGRIAAFHPSCRMRWQRHRRDVGDVELDDERLLDARGSVFQHLGHALLHLKLGVVEVCAIGKPGTDDRCALARRTLHSLDAWGRDTARSMGTVMAFYVRRTGPG